MSDIGEHPYTAVYDALRKAVEYSRTRGNALLIRVSREHGFICFFADGSVETAPRLCAPAECQCEEIQVWRNAELFDKGLIREVGTQGNANVFSGFERLFGRYEYCPQLEPGDFEPGARFASTQSPKECHRVSIGRECHPKAQGRISNRLSGGTKRKPQAPSFRDGGAAFLFMVASGILGR